MATHMISRYAIQRQRQLLTFVPSSRISDQLPANARETRPSEPTLFPKLRICFADFPDLHCSKTRGFSPWRPAADMGTASPDNKFFPGIFKGRQRYTWQYKKRTALRRHYPYLATIAFQGLRSLQRKENSSTNLRRRLPVQLCCHVCVQRTLYPVAGLGILTQFPFAPGGYCINRLTPYIHESNHLHLRNELPDRLGPPDPRSTAVHTEPFSTSVFKVLTWIFATTTKICTRGGSTCTHVHSFQAHHGALLLVTAFNISR